MSDGSIKVQSSKIWGYEPQGSIEIAAPGALHAVAPKRKRRKNQPQSVCRLRRQTAPVLYVKQGKEKERETTNCPPKRVRSRPDSEESEVRSYGAVHIIGSSADAGFSQGDLGKDEPASFRRSRWRERRAV